MTTSAGDRWVRILSVLVPREIREHFLADLLAERADMRVRGLSRFRINLASAGELLEGIVQHVPLRPRLSETHSEQPVVAETAARVGWYSWRACGTAIFIGHVIGSMPLLLSGFALMLTAFVCLGTVALTAQPPLGDRQSDLVTGVLVGTVTILGFTLLFGALTIGMLALAALFSAGSLASVGFRILVFTATASAFAVTASGWVPSEWYPKRLVRSREPEDHLDAYEDQEVAEEYEQEQQERRYALDYVQS